MLGHQIVLRQHPLQSFTAIHPIAVEIFHRSDGLTDTGLPRAMLLAWVSRRDILMSPPVFGALICSMSIFSGRTLSEMHCKCATLVLHEECMNVSYVFCGLESVWGRYFHLWELKMIAFSKIHSLSFSLLILLLFLARQGPIFWQVCQWGL